jgi:hypothetical protein
MWGKQGGKGVGWGGGGARQGPLFSWMLLPATAGCGGMIRVGQACGDVRAATRAGVQLHIGGCPWPQTSKGGVASGPAGSLKAAGLLLRPSLLAWGAGDVPKGCHSG